MKKDLVYGSRAREEKQELEVTCSPYVMDDLKEFSERRIYLQGEINSLDQEDRYIDDKITVSRIVRLIMKYNREDMSIEPNLRKPIRLYINSPGGELYEGFSLVSAIELSKTPVYTYNIGQWSSMAFLIGIAGHKRFSLPNMMFLMHDGSNFMYGSSNKVKDEAKFNEKYEQYVVKPHILKHSRMGETEYEALSRIEYYMLPEDAKSHGFIDDIVSDLDQIL